jgi:hypothetical protein
MSNHFCNNGEQKIKIIMQKVKSNARWTALSSENLQTLDKWLFDENLSYAAIFPRAQTELGYKGHISSLKRYFLRRRKERVTEEFKDLRNELAAISDAPANADSFRQASMKLMGTFLFQQLRRSPENVKEWAAVAKLMVQNDYNELLRETKEEEFNLRRELKAKDYEIRRELKAEDRQVRRESLDFLREKFQFDIIENAVKALPALMELCEARKDPNLNRYAHNARWNKARRAMFGPNSQVLPETAEEEAEMLAARKERGEKGLEENRIIEVQPPTPLSPYYKEYMEEKAKREIRQLE